jgi:hypothetical protein
MDDLQKAPADFQALQEELRQSPYRRHPYSYHRKIRRDVSSGDRTKSIIPRPVHHHQPLCPMTAQEALATRIKLHAFITHNHGLPAQFTPDELHFVIDTGASITITNSKDDFVSTIHPIQPTKLQGIASGLEVKGIGDAEYTFRAVDGKLTSVLFQRVYTYQIAPCVYYVHAI